MRNLMRILIGIVGGLAIVAACLFVWSRTLARDDGGVGRPTHGTYTWPMPEQQVAGDKAGPASGPVDDDPAMKPKYPTPRGGPTPRADGYVMGSLNHDFILPPMPPERKWDIHRADSVFRNATLRSCFWPGPKLRPGFYTTDPDDYGHENQIPDNMNTFNTAWFRIPPGAKIVVKGAFPHMRHWSFTTYSENGVPPTPRPRNTVYTLAEPGTPIGMHMRNYVPDRSVDYLGGAGVPEVELHLADGTLLKGEEACTATAAPLRGKQVPLTVSKTTWMALNSLPWRPADRTPAHDFTAEPMEKFYNREHLIMKTFFPVLPSDYLAVEKGGFWSNPATRYGYKYISQAYGKVYVVRGKMPRAPQTWAGDPAPMDQDADMRYWSICTAQAPPAGNPVDCLFDEAVLPTVDAKGFFTVVVSRAPDRPANATEKCGVAWMEWGNGDGIPGGSADYGSIINRHTHVNPKFRNSWFAVEKPNTEAKAMGEYLPYVINLRDKAKFEALGCPVDTVRLALLQAPPAVPGR